MGIPPVFPELDEFSALEFPYCQFPLAIQDWCDALAFFYVSGDAGMRRHSQDYKVVEVARYTFREAGGHQVVVAKVQVRSGVFKLLRIERDGTAKDVKVGEADVEALEPMDLPAPRRSLNSNIPGSSKGPVQSLPESAEVPATFSSPHPSISVYTKPGVTEEDCKTNFLVDSVQTTFEDDLRTLMLVECLNPQNLHLHHLALLVAEVHKRFSESGHQCALFADLIMRVISRDMAESVKVSNGLKGKVPEDGEVEGVSHGNAGSGKVVEILKAYQTVRESVDDRVS